MFILCMGTKGYYICGACGTKIRADKWNKHCNTKQHLKHQNNSIWSKLIFNSSMGTQQPILYTFLPKTKYGEYGWGKK